jgi:hypothetical protein
MMKNTCLVITSIANDKNSVLMNYAKECKDLNIPFIVIGDTKSPSNFELQGCDFYSIESQKKLNFFLVELLPEKHYARKNLGYLIAIKSGSKIIIETDDDNLPLKDFWKKRDINTYASELSDKKWVNVYKYFTDLNIWPRGFPLQNINDKVPELGSVKLLYSPIQQGLADDNPDVDAIYRLVLPLPVKFKQNTSIALSNNSYCPFNSQNTTWFSDAFPLLYLPSYCSFRMTDIWRSFIAQRISWTCGWSILFNSSTVYQNRNDHSIIKDFEEEISGYLNNSSIMEKLINLSLEDGVKNIPLNMMRCYELIVEMGLIDKKELTLIDAWFMDLKKLNLIH